MTSFADANPDLGNEIEQLRSLLNSTDLTLTKFVNEVSKMFTQVSLLVDDENSRNAGLTLASKLPSLREEFATFRGNIEVLFALLTLDFKSFQERGH